MAVLSYTSPETYGVADQCLGLHIYEGLSGSGIIQVRDVIYADYLSIQPDIPELFFLSAVFSPVSFVTSFNNEVVKMIDGNPPGYQFGSITFNHLGTFADKTFVSYEAQQYNLKEALIQPEPLDIPPNMSALPTPELDDAMFRSTYYGLRVPNTKTSQFTTCLKFNYDLKPSVIANIGFIYYAYVNTFDSSPSSNITAVAF